MIGVYGEEFVVHMRCIAAFFDTGNFLDLPSPQGRGRNEFSTEYRERVGGKINYANVSNDEEAKSDSPMARTS